MMKWTLPPLILFLSGLTAVAQTPSITGFSPMSAMAGQTVTIQGANFSPTVPANIVYFGAVKAQVRSASPTTLSVTVPAGSTAQPLSVTVGGLTGISSQSFNLTFPGSASPAAATPLADRAFILTTDSLTNFANIDVHILDIDGDGKPDAVVLNNQYKKIYLLLNTGTPGQPSFGTGTSIPTGNSPQGLAVADIDGDGRKDLLVCNASDSNFSVYINTGSPGAASFSPAQSFHVGKFTEAIFTGDFDNDGKTDVALVNGSDNTVSVFRNTSGPGTVSFATAVDFPTGSVPVSGASADMDGDGKQDMVVVNRSGYSVSILRNTSTPGALSFAGRSDISLGNMPSCVSIADLDGDGRPDIAVGYFQVGTVTVLKNSTTAGQLSFAPQQNYGVGGSAATLAIADLDGDGRPDIVAPNSNGIRVSVLRNLDTGGNLLFSPWTDYLNGNSVYGAAVADMDGDGRPDIITANYLSGTVSILRNKVPDPEIRSFTPGAGGNGSRIVINGFNFSNTTSVRIGGTPALSFSVDSSTGISATIGTGANGPVTVTTPYGTAQRSGFVYTTIPDITAFSPASGGKGTAVTITGINFTGVTSVAFGGIAADSFTVISPTAIRATVGAVATGDLTITVTNAAGTDSITGFYTGPTITSFFPTSGPAGSTVTITGTHFASSPSANSVHFGAALATVIQADSVHLKVTVPPNATYQPITVTSGNLTAAADQPFIITFKGTRAPFVAADFVDKADSLAGNFSVDIAAGDLDGDGKTDLVLTNFGNTSISVLRNTSAGSTISFEPHVDYPVGAYPFCSVIADLDGDGRPDIVVGKSYDNITFADSITVFLNTSTAGQLSLSAPKNIYAGYESSFSSAVVADFDGDGRPDIAMVSDQYVSIFRNTSRPGSLSFAAPFFAGTGDFYLGTGSYAADIDLDGKPDLIIGGVFVLHNTSAAGTISFTQTGPLANLSPGFGTSGVAVGDLDGDGLPDIAAMYFGNDLLSIYHNKSKDGTISFGDRTDYPLVGNTYHVAIGDLDGDGKPDVICNTSGSNAVTLLKNHSTPGNISFSTDLAMTSHPGYDLRAIAIADLNGDGMPDISIANSSPGSASAFINMRAGDGLPSATILADGPTQFCPGDSVILFTPSVSGAIYQWYNNGQPIAGANDTSYIARSSGSYSVGTNASGDSASSTVLDVVVNTAPDAPLITAAANSGGVSTGAAICAGEGLTLSSSVATADQWYKNGSAIAGGNTQQLQITDSGVYTVRTLSVTCPSPLAQPYTVSLTPIPSASISPAAPPAFCQGDSVVLTAGSAGGNTGGNTYQWNIADAPLPGASRSSYAATVSGNYTITVSNNGCTSVSKPVTVLQTPIPPKPVITKTASGLSSSSPAGNQWYREGVPLPGDTSRIFQPADTAWYAVSVSIGGCASPLSDTAYLFTSTGSGPGNGGGNGNGGTNPPDSSDSARPIHLGPNPVTDQLSVSFSIAGTPSLQLLLVDINGRIVREWEDVQSGNLLHLSGIPRGIYFAKFFSPDGRIHAVISLLKE